MRRALLGASLGLALSLTASPPALAAGRQSDGELKRDYYTNTAEIIKQIKEIFALGGELTNDANKDKLLEFKKSTQAWVGDYRRLVGPGQTSYGLVYGVINSVLGYFTTVGIGNRALPKKVLEGQSKRIAQAETAIKREMQREGLPPLTFA